MRLAPVAATTATVTLVTVFATPGVAHAGGIEFPDNGTVALGRGTAFVAKADDPSAFYHNPAGLARQRGTNFLINGHFFFNSYEFRRSGNYPDDPQDPATPWGGYPYPATTNIAGAFATPLIALATDFHYFDRLTVAAGLFAPTSVGNRTFPVVVARAPASSRYDFVQSRTTLAYPTLSAAFRATKWLDLGMSGHLVLANFDQSTISFADAVQGQCKTVEDFRCDSLSTLKTSAKGVAATFGVHVRPAASYSFGATFRTPLTLTSEGQVTSDPPRSAAIQVPPGAARLIVGLPWAARVGARYIKMDRDFEVYDLELDFKYEAWSSAQGSGNPRIQVAARDPLPALDAEIVHRYRDTYSVRGGGAYNFQTSSGVLTLRAGGYYESPSTFPAYTRLDFDTLPKIAGTLGIGFASGAFRFDAGYGAIASVPRVVGPGQGDVRPINGSRGGAPVDSADNLLPAINEGAYRGFTHFLSAGMTITFDAFFGPARPIHYGNAYEPNYVGDEEEKPATNNKPGNDKPADDGKGTEDGPADDTRQDDSGKDDAPTKETVDN